VLLYTIDEDPAAASKRQRAQQLLLSERWGWSVQVAVEFFVNATSTKRPFRLAAADAAALVETWFAFPTVGITPALVRAAIHVRERFQLSYWDAAILAAAKEMGCRTVFR
jgi:predicted nucleic acid-binding protein